MRPPDSLLAARAAEATARAGLAEVGAMIDAWRARVGAGPEEPPPPELRACLMVAAEELELAELLAEQWADHARGDFAPFPEEFEQREAREAELERAREDAWFYATTGGSHGDA